jgi:hypothetical protein
MNVKNSNGTAYTHSQKYHVKFMLYRFSQQKEYAGFMSD